MKLKAEKVPYVNSWAVVGLGYFDSEEEANKAIRENQNTIEIHVTISPLMQEQLKTLAVERDTTVTDIIRQAIMKEVQNG